jgi:hypothetical protein
VRGGVQFYKRIVCYTAAVRENCGKVMAAQGTIDPTMMHVPPKNFSSVPPAFPHQAPVKLLILYLP